MLVFEALNALHGDCLLLRMGEDGEILWVIDGGPKAKDVDGTPVVVRRDVLMPRLRQLVPEPGPVPVSLGICTHIDDDHINGMNALAKAAAAGEPQVAFARFWFNDFEALLAAAKAVAPAAGAAPAALAPALLAAPDEIDAAVMVQSVTQGNKLATDLRTAKIDLNGLFLPGRVVMASAAKPTYWPEAGVSVTLLGPSAKRLAQLKVDWDEMRPPAAGVEGAAMLRKSKLDRSKANLSSIAFLLESEGRSLLLTGDALAADLVDFWKNELKRGETPVNLLKIPHHGSARNMTTEFLRTFPAEHYVISADGEHDNPDPQVIEEIVKVGGARRFTLHFTNRPIHWEKPYTLDTGGASAQTLDDLLTALHAAYPGPWTENFRAPGALGIEIPLA